MNVLRDYNPRLYEILEIEPRLLSKAQLSKELYKWLKYNYENFDKPEWIVSNPINPAAERIREKILGKPQSLSPMREYDLDYTQGKLDL